MFDILVIGGGLSGVCSAIASARLGKKTLLVEKYNSLGGTASFGLVIPFMYYQTQSRPFGENISLCGGIFKEIVARMKELGGTLEGWDECFNEEILKLVLNRMCQESGVELLFNTHLVSAKNENGTIKSVEVSNISGKKTLYADYFIDATGDGNLAFLSGFDFMLGRESDSLCQPMTLSFRLANVDIPLFRKEEKKIQELYKKHKDEGKIMCPRENLLIFETTVDKMLHFNTTRVIKLNPTIDTELTKAELEGREQVFEIYSFLKSNFDAFKNSSLVSTGMQIGIRESRRVLGEYVLRVDEIKSCARFHDAIATCNYDIDIHSPDGEGTSHYYFPSGDYYEIPYRCLVPKGAKNLLVAGRCISCDHETQASLRIMPTCASVGESAGTAVAMCHSSRCDVLNVDIKKLQEELIKNKCML